MDQSNPKASDPRNLRRPWNEGPDEDAPEESWLALGDDALLHRIETHERNPAMDERLLEVVRSDRHFFIRQEAAKKVHDRNLLFAFEDDRHIGQILVRYLTRREDVTYLERLVAASRHTEVRAAAQVQLAQLWGRLGGPTSAAAAEDKVPPPPRFETPPEPVMPPPRAAPPDPPAEREVEIEVEPDTTDLAAVAAAAAESVAEAEPTPSLEPEPVAEPAPAAETETAERSADSGVDGSLLGWAVHFLVEQAWPYLDTQAARGLLLRTHAELLPFRPALAMFSVEEDAHVHVDLSFGARLPREAVAAVAVWMAAFIEATRASVPELGEIDVRKATHLMADALEAAGFYDAFQDLEEA